MDYGNGRKKGLRGRDKRRARQARQPFVRVGQGERNTDQHTYCPCPRRLGRMIRGETDQSFPPQQWQGKKTPGGKGALETSDPPAFSTQPLTKRTPQNHAAGRPGSPLPRHDQWRRDQHWRGGQDIRPRRDPPGDSIYPAGRRASPHQQLDQLAAQGALLTQLASLSTSSSSSAAARSPHDEAPDDDLFREANGFQRNESDGPCVPANTTAAVNAGLLELFLNSRHTVASSTAPKAAPHCFWRIKNIPRVACPRPASE